MSGCNLESGYESRRIIAKREGDVSGRQKIAIKVTLIFETEISPEIYK
jgi:hypothetical protein